MTKQSSKWMSALAVSGMLALPIAGAAQAAPGVEESVTNTATGQTRTQLVHTVAIVKEINRSDRSLILAKDDGEATTVHVPGGVKGFDALKIGDKVDVDYYESWPSRWHRRGRSRASPSARDRRWMSAAASKVAN